jgi:hypothetical protein
MINNFKFSNYGIINGIGIGIAYCIGNGNGNGTGNGIGNGIGNEAELYNNNYDFVPLQFLGLRNQP